MNGGLAQPWWKFTARRKAMLQIGVCNQPKIKGK